jgi:flagellar hook-associated protein 2
MAISVSGIGSGLDIEGIVSQLMAVEQQPLLRLASKEADIQATISSVGEFRSVLSTFRDAVNALGGDGAFDAVGSESTNEDAVTVSADGDAALGSFTVDVTRLAQAHKQASAAFASTDTFGGGLDDAVTFTVGGNSLTIDLSTAKTLSQIREEIIAAGADIDLSATLISEVGDGSAQRLVLSSGETGYDGRIQVAFGGTLDTDPATDPFSFATTNTDPDGVTLLEGQLDQLDASFSVDGFAMTRSNNEIDNAITGVTFTLAGVGAADISVARDGSQVSTAVSGMVDAYNELQTSLSSLSGGALANDSMIRSVQSRVRSLIGQGYDSLGNFSSLSELGVSFTREGQLTFDQAKLDEAIASDRASVQTLFSDEDSGFVTRMDTALEGYLGTSGIIDARVDGLNARVDSLQDQQTVWERRLITIEQRYRAEFTALDTLVASLSATSQFLVGQLDGLPGFTRDDS